MSGFRIDFPRDQSIDANSTVRSGAKFYVYSNETTTPVTLYSDRDVATTRANPVSADSAGLFPVVYVATDSLLTLVLKTSADVLLESWDDYEPQASVDNSDLANYLALAGGTMTGAIRFKEGNAVASATTIDLDASGGNFNHISGTTGISAVTLAQAAMRWVVFDAALTLTHSVNLILPNSLDITTVAGDCALLVGEGSGVTRLLWYRCVDGKPLIENGDYQFAGSDESTNLTTGTAKVTFRMPWTIYLDQLPIGSLSVAQTAGSLLAFDINVSAVSIFSTVLTIDNNELDSSTAATPAVLSTTSITAGATVTFDIDTVGTAGARGAKVLLRGYRRNR